MHYFGKYSALVRKDMNVYEHERLSNITLKTQIKVKEQQLYCCFTFCYSLKIHKNDRVIKWTSLYINCISISFLFFFTVDFCVYNNLSFFDYNIDHYRVGKQVFIFIIMVFFQLYLINYANVFVFLRTLLESQGHSNSNVAIFYIHWLTWKIKPLSNKNVLTDRLHIPEFIIMFSCFFL